MNGELKLEQTAEVLADVYTDYVKTSEVAEEHEEILAEITYAPWAVLHLVLVVTLRGNAMSIAEPHVSIIITLLAVHQSMRLTGVV